MEGRGALTLPRRSWRSFSVNLGFGGYACEKWLKKRMLEDCAGASSDGLIGVSEDVAWKKNKKMELDLSRL
jgi:hypothetical protein